MKDINYRQELYEEPEMFHRSREFHEYMEGRRSLREFSSRPVDQAIIRELILTASTAPSGAHRQPWTFCAVADPLIKSRIRTEAEKEEKESYEGRMSEEWLEDLAPLGTDWHKPFLEIAPWLIIVFRKPWDFRDGSKRQNYYVNESVGIACGFLLAAIRQAGLVALTHTPSPMNFLAEILSRPENEKPYLLIPVGYPPEEAKVPDLKRKSEEEVIRWYI